MEYDKGMGQDISQVAEYMRKQIELHVEEFATQVHMTDYVLRVLAPHERDTYAREVAFQLIRRLPVQNLGRDGVEYPKDWWQAFKDRWFPLWAKKRWPVIMHKFIVDFKVAYMDLAIPDKQTRFYYNVMEFVDIRRT